MSTPTNDPFLKSSYSLEEEGLARLPSPIPQSANVTSASLNIARPSSAPPILITPSSTIPVADMAMPITGKIIFVCLPQSEHFEHQLLIKTKLQAIGLGSPQREKLGARNKLLLSPLVCIDPNPLSFIISNTDLDFLSSHLPLSPPIAPVLNVDKLSGDTEVTVACEI